MAKFTVIDPATEEVLSEFNSAGAKEVARAVASAKKAFESWRSVPSQEKAEMLHEIAKRLRENTQKLAETLTREGGKPLRENVDEIGWTASCFDFYAELARAGRGRVIPSTERSQLNLVVKEPYGVVGAIVPWNYPLLLMAWKVAPALAAGNTVVLKPAEQTPLATKSFVEMTDVLPNGVLELVLGGPATGAALVSHQDVAFVAFTGSLEVGRKISHVCADQMKRCHLELGGKDAFVVCEDSDLDLAVRAVAWAAFLNTGQVCTSAERVYVHDSIAKSFTERLLETTQKLKVGPGMDPTTDVGPMIRGEYRRKVKAHVDSAVRRGAKLLTGGKVPTGKGFFFAPTVLAGVAQDMTVMRDETFGPVCPVATFRDFDEAIRLVNDSIYGLGSNLYTHDARKAKRFFEDVQAGTIWINDPLTDNDAGPFGGYKASGGGRELGYEGLEAFQQSKHIHWDFEQNAKPWWYPYAEAEVSKN
ncbi:MAG: aldehyde dehydrogenase family protein [Elusimicrobiota bacterium]